MFYLISLFIALIFAIPTSGFSLLVFFIAKILFDRAAANSIVGAMKSSLEIAEGINLYHINRAAIKRSISIVGVDTFETHLNGGYSFYTAIGTHPMINNGEVFSVLVSYSPRDGTKNTIEVFAAPGVREHILNIGQ